jgi:hypothetical protein
MVRGVVTLPHGTGTLKFLAPLIQMLEAEAKEAGAGLH